MNGIAERTHPGMHIHATNSRYSTIVVAATKKWYAATANNLRSTDNASTDYN